MKKLWMVLLATVLAVAAIISHPVDAHASVACDQCALTGDCFACCRCAGSAPIVCYNACP